MEWGGLRCSGVVYLGLLERVWCSGELKPSAPGNCVACPRLARCHVSDSRWQRNRQRDGDRGRNEKPGSETAGTEKATCAPARAATNTGARACRRLAMSAFRRRGSLAPAPSSSGLACAAICSRCPGGTARSARGALVHRVRAGARPRGCTAEPAGTRTWCCVAANFCCCCCCCCCMNDA